MTLFTQEGVFGISELPDPFACPPAIQQHIDNGCAEAERLRFERRVEQARLVIGGVTIFFAGMFVGMFWTACQRGML